MKNLLLSALACIISFTVTLFALNKFVGNQSVEKTSISNTNDEFNEEFDEQTNEEINTEDEYQIENIENDSISNDSISIDEEPIKEEIVYTTNVDASSIEKKYKDWLNYNVENIELSSEFTAINTENTIIEKEEFLKELTTGLYIPLKVENKNDAYKLYKLTEVADKKITRAIKGKSLVAYEYFKMEGEPLPSFTVKDLYGSEYSSPNDDDKIMVIKCWFINCAVCVEEFPELNELYDRYEGSDNISFISLAFDKPEKLKKFLSKKEFRFPVIAEQKKYMTKKLPIKQYPTHIIVDEEGNIIKMVSNVKALIRIVDQLVGSEEFIE